MAETKPMVWELAETDIEMVRVARGPLFVQEGEGCQVIELEPVLDLLERLLDWASPYHESAEAEPEIVADREAVEALLREHGRLSDD